MTNSEIFKFRNEWLNKYYRQFNLKEYTGEEL